MSTKALATVNTEQLLLWGPKISSGLLVVGIAYALTQLVWLFTGSATAPVAEPAEAIVQSGPAQTPAGQHAKEIAMRHLFGEAKVDVNPQIADVKETPLNLKLVGIWSTGEDQGFALIASGGSDEEVYSIGEKVPGNATLKAVYADRVILESNRGLESLKLPKESGLIDFGSGDSGSAGPTDPGAFSDDMSLNDMRRELVENQGALAQMAQAFSPARSDNGDLLGYRLAPNMSDPLYQQLGLQPDDVITSINGVTLNRPENTLRAMQRLRNDKTLSITILRDGQEIPIEHIFQEPNL